MLRIGGPDLVILVAYLVAIVSFGLWVGIRQRRRAAAEGGYFLAGRTLGWAPVGLALFSTNISTVHLVSLAEQGYVNGLAFGNFEWMAAFTLIALALFFVPFYLQTRVATLPDFLERRYGRPCRDYLAVVSIISAVFIHIGFSLYAGAVVLHALFGINVWVSVVTLTILTGVYTLVGGLMAVVFTESVETVVLLLGAVCITIFAFLKAGGVGEAMGMIAAAGEKFPSATMSMLRPHGDPSGIPWYGFLLGYPVIGLWYWCADQTIVQRVLGAKSENDARVGALFAGFIKILPVFVFVLPGLVYLGLTKDAPVADTKAVYAHMIQELLPVGVRGVVAAALVAALMSTISGALNSIATLFSYDLYRRFRPEASERRTVLVGRVATLIAVVIAIAWTPFVAQFKTIFDGISALICFIAPPITTVFVWGVFWKPASARGALVTLWSGFAVCSACFILFYAPAEWAAWLAAVAPGPGGAWGRCLAWYAATVPISYMLATFLLFLVCSGILVVASRLRPDAPDAPGRQLVWGNALDAFRRPAWPGLGNYRLLSVLLVAAMLLLYAVFH